MGRGNKCKEKLEDTCFNRTNARCVDYEGNLPESLDNSKCYSSHDILEHLIECCEENDISDLDLGCLELEGDFKLKEVLNAIIEKFCENNKCNLSLNYEKNASFGNDCSDKISINVTGGSGDYSYRWYVSGISESIVINNSADNYAIVKNSSLTVPDFYSLAVEVTDNVSGCQISGSVMGFLNICIN